MKAQAICVPGPVSKYRVIRIPNKYSAEAQKQLLDYVRKKFEPTAYYEMGEIKYKRHYPFSFPALLVLGGFGAFAGAFLAAVNHNQEVFFTNTAIGILVGAGASFVYSLFTDATFDKVKIDSTSSHIAIEFDVTDGALWAEELIDYLGNGKMEVDHA